MDENYEAQFASCEVKWEIENFCFAHPSDDWSISSSVFILQGLKSVRWRTSLELEKFKSSVANENDTADENDISFEKSKAAENSKTDQNINAGENSVSGESSKNCGVNSKDSTDDTTCLVSVYLEKMPIYQDCCAAYSQICVNWKIKLTVGNKEFGPHEKIVEFGEVSKHGQIGIATSREILENLDPFNPDTIVISLFFLAFDVNKPVELDNEVPRGLLLLSADLKRLKDMEKNYTDIKLKVTDDKNDKIIQAHQVILFRNLIFSGYLTRARDGIIEMPNIEYKTLNEFVNFLYSGETLYFIENISLYMLRFMDYFKCDALEPYYIPEEISLNSKIKVKSHVYQWHVEKSVLVGVDCVGLPSPSIRILHSGTVWHLIVSSKKIGRERFISIFAYITEGEKPKHFSLEFAMVNESKIKYFSRRLIKHFANDQDENYENLGIEYFVREADLKKYPSLTYDDCLRFLFRVNTSDLSQECSMGPHTMHFISPIQSKSYKMLSDELLKMLENKWVDCDITIKCNDKRYIEAHKAILVARSPGFQQRIEDDLVKETNTLYLWHEDYTTVKQSIRYIYKGILDSQMEAVITQLYYFSSPGKFDIPSLYEESLECLRKKGAYIYS